jgi:hypothetical protein
LMLATYYYYLTSGYYLKYVLVEYLQMHALY